MVAIVSCCKNAKEQFLPAVNLTWNYFKKTRRSREVAMLSSKICLQLRLVAKMQKSSVLPAVNLT
jgi:hypothetical protein